VQHVKDILQARQMVIVIYMHHDGPAQARFVLAAGQEEGVPLQVSFQQMIRAAQSPSMFAHRMEDAA
jgi:uncharacterized membrane protein